MSNSALAFLITTQWKNYLKRLLRKPLKLIGTLLAIFYFLMIPFFFKDFLDHAGLANPFGYALVIIVFNLYLIAPSYLSYLKHKGIIFSSADVNFIFPAPISPKAAIVYAIVKKSYLNIIMQAALIIAGIFIFHVPFLPLLLYTLVSLCFSFPVSYALAILMYAHEKLTDKIRRIIRYFMFSYIAALTLTLAYFLLKQGLSLASIVAALNLPILLFLPVIGWELAFIQGLFWGFNLVNIIGSIIYFVSGIALIVFVTKMKSSGAYYEDALSFASDYEKALLKNKQNKGGFENLIKKKKKYETKQEIKQLYGRALFDKEILENRRTHRLFLKFSDLILLVISIALGFSLRGLIGEKPDLSLSLLYYAFIAAIVIYLNSFFARSSFWQKEVNHYLFFLIPDSTFKKLYYASTLDLLSLLLRSVVLVLPLTLIAGIPFIHIPFALLFALSLQVFELYLAMGVKEFLGRYVGNTMTQLLYIFISLTFSVLPVLIIFLIALALSANILPFVIGLIFFYLILAWFALWIASKTLTYTHIEQESSL